MSHLPVRRLPEFDFLRGAKFFTGPLAAVARKAVEVAGRAAGGRCIFPTSFEPAGFFESHEDGIESAGSEAGGLAESVAVVPGRRLKEQGLEEVESLAGDADAQAHGISLHR